MTWIPGEAHSELRPSIRRSFCLALSILVYLAVPADGQAATASSADGTVRLAVPSEWMVITPKDGPVVLFLTEKNEAATVTVLREDLGASRGQSAIRCLFMKLDNFEQSLRMENQTDPIPVAIQGREAARASFESVVKQPDGKRLRGSFVFTCLPVGDFLYTIVGNARADEMAAWQPILDEIAGSLEIDG